MSERIFSGKSSQKFWDAVNKYKDDILYEYGCKAQEIEQQRDDLLAAQALTILKQQPKAGEFTSFCRYEFKANMDICRWDSRCGKAFKEVCARLDQAEALNSELLGALETAEKELEQRYEAQKGSPIDILTLKIIKAAIAKAKQ